ncbi:unnamed protein product [Pylaiella littoralis]
MAVGVCADDRQSLGQASKQWRLKRRRAAGLHVTELQRHKIAHVQVLPLPSSSVNTTTSNTNNTNSYRTFDDTTSGNAKALNSPKVDRLKHRRSEAGIERVSAECGAHVTGEEDGAATVAAAFIVKRDCCGKFDEIYSETNSAPSKGVLVSHARMSFRGNHQPPASPAASFVREHLHRGHLHHRLCGGAFIWATGASVPTASTVCCSTGQRHGKRRKQQQQPQQQQR